MIITQFIKQLNRTEVGLTETKDFFAHVPAPLVNILLNSLPPLGSKLDVTDISSGLLYPKSDICLKKRKDNNQFRIEGLGPFFAKNSASAGDKFIFEIHNENKKNKYFIGLEKRSHVIMFQRSKIPKRKINGVAVLNPDLFYKYYTNGIFTMSIFYQGKEINVEIKWIYNKKKNKTYPDKVAFYDIKANGQSILSDFKLNNDYGELDLTDRVLRKVCTYEMNIFKYSLK